MLSIAASFGTCAHCEPPPMNDISTLLAALVKIPSINPSLVPGAPGEAEIARWVRGWLEGQGIECQVIDAAPGRSSVIGRVPGRGGGQSLLLNAHLDTVGVAGMADPFAACIRAGRLYGRGAFDMKGSLAACMLAVAEIRPQELAGDVILTAVADEEHASLGVQSVLEHVRADAAIVTEPTSLQVCVAHKGFSWHEITTSGVAAHGSRPDLGVDAIAHMGRVLVRLEALQDELSRRAPHPLLGHASVHASIISGGQELSSYPARCELQLERRTLPGETTAEIDGEFSVLLSDLAAGDDHFHAQFKTTLVRPPFCVDHDAPIVQMLSGQAARVLGRAPEIVGASYWMDAAFLAQAGIPTVVIGPHGAGAHAVEEWVDLDSVNQCRRILVETIREFCRT
jgi:acetylornithine deacetylase